MSVAKIIWILAENFLFDEDKEIASIIIFYADVFISTSSQSSVHVYLYPQPLAFHMVAFFKYPLNDSLLSLHL